MTQEIEPPPMKLEDDEIEIFKKIMRGARRWGTIRDISEITIHRGECHCGHKDCGKIKVKTSKGEVEVLFTEALKITDEAWEEKLKGGK